MSDVFEATIELPAVFAGTMDSVTLRAELASPAEMSGTIESGDVKILEWGSLEW